MDPTDQDSSDASSDSDSDPNAGADIESVIDPIVDPDALIMAHQCADAQAAPGADPDAVMNDNDQWYVDVLGFPKSTAKALYKDQTLTGKRVLVDLTNETVDKICSAVRKPGGASQGDLTPV